jgi:hypothetical protein
MAELVDALDLDSSVEICGGSSPLLGTINKSKQKGAIMSLVLVVDKGGMPKDWVNFEIAACYYAKEKVLWELGSKIKTLIGGFNNRGERSQIDISSIIGVSGPILGDRFYNKQTLFADRMTLYARDQHICAYCGNEFATGQLTIDHVIPKSRGGGNNWANCVTACRPCNHRKGWKTPEEAKMHLLFLMHRQCMREFF